MRGGVDTGTGRSHSHCRMPRHHCRCVPNHPLVTIPDLSLHFNIRWMTDMMSMINLVRCRPHRCQRGRSRRKRSRSFSFTVAYLFSMVCLYQPFPPSPLSSFPYWKWQCKWQQQWSQRQIRRRFVMISAAYWLLHICCPPPWVWRFQPDVGLASASPDIVHHQVRCQR